jgi:ArsR family transcriptional regulator
VSVDALQRLFKTLTDPTRVRILALLEREELAVQDLVKVLDLAQSTVSRHLAILRENGLIHDRREGTFAFYRFVEPVEDAWRGAWQIAARALADDPLATKDRAALEAVLREREIRTRSFFDSIGPEWDSLRRVFDDDTQRARAIARLVSPGLVVADIGTGTGILAKDLSRCGASVIAVDNSRRMLAAARAKLDAEGIAGVELRHGDATSLPIADGEVDAALAHMVLQYVASPAEAIREMARVVRPGGRVVVVDFVENDRTWMKEELGVLWQGFDPAIVQGWLESAGLVDARVEVVEPATRGSDLPSTFIASATSGVECRA